MRTLYADENFNRKIVRGILECKPEIPIFRVQQFGLGGIEDPELLEWLAQGNGVLLSHDYATVPHFANERLRKGLRMTGVLMVPQTTNLQQMIEEIILAVECFSDDEWDSQVRYLPF
jgi:hypothetical protein